MVVVCPCHLVCLAAALLLQLLHPLPQGQEWTLRRLMHCWWHLPFLYTLYISPPLPLRRLVPSVSLASTVLRCSAGCVHICCCDARHGRLRSSCR